MAADRAVRCPIALAACAARGRTDSHKWLKARNRGGLSKPFWAGTAVSATHCGAGCVPGDLIAEWTVCAAGLPWPDTRAVRHLHRTSAVIDTPRGNRLRA